MESSNLAFFENEGSQNGNLGEREEGGKSNTLGELTQTFVRLIQSTPHQLIQIDDASKHLKIQKRRIYDITNVLEGIGYIEKTHKNEMQWVGGEKDHELSHQLKEL